MSYRWAIAGVSAVLAAGAVVWVMESRETRVRAARLRETRVRAARLRETIANDERRLTEARARWSGEIPPNAFEYTLPRELDCLRAFTAQEPLPLTVCAAVLLRNSREALVRLNYAEEWPSAETVQLRNQSGDSMDLPRDEGYRRMDVWEARQGFIVYLVRLPLDRGEGTEWLFLADGAVETRLLSRKGTSDWVAVEVCDVSEVNDPEPFIVMDALDELK